MPTNVDKIVGDIIERVRPLVREAVQKAEAEARGEMLEQFTKAVSGASQVKSAAATATVVKRKPGRPRKNPAPEAQQASGSEEKPAKRKAKRVLSEEVRQKLQENLKKARDAKADKVKPAKRKPGRPRKVQPEVAAVESAPAAEQQA